MATLYILVILVAMVSDVHSNAHPDMIMRNGYQMRASYNSDTDVLCTIEVYDLGYYCPKNDGLALLSTAIEVKEFLADMTTEVANGPYSLSLHDNFDVSYSRDDDGEYGDKGSSSWAQMEFFLTKFFGNTESNYDYTDLKQSISVFDEGFFMFDYDWYTTKEFNGVEMERFHDGDLLITYWIDADYCANALCEGNNGTEYGSLTVELLDENLDPPKSIKGLTLMFESGMKVEFLPNKYAKYDRNVITGGIKEYSWISEDQELVSVTLDENNGLVTIMFPIVLEDIDDVLANNGQGFNIHPTIRPANKAVPARQRRSPVPQREEEMKIFARIYFPDCKERQDLLGLGKSGADKAKNGVFILLAAMAFANLRH